MTDPKVRIFISSPSDLEHERALVKDIIASLAQEYLPYFSVQAVLWEEEALTAARSFQAGLLRPAECEIVLVMLWTRLGTPLADDPYGGMTGTEWEFVDAVEASAHAGTPEVLVYRKTAPRLIDINDAAAISAAVSDRERLETFFRAHFHNPDGSFRRAFRQFDSDAVFRDLVENQLRKLLNRRISAERRFALGVADWRGSPFRAGRPFDIGDERIFTGREAETRELIARLDALRGAGGGMLLLSGPSGVGKSSLIRAGLVPHLKRPLLFSDVSACRWCLIDLTEHDDPTAALVHGLMAPGMLGAALTALGLETQALARLLCAEPEVGAQQIRAALAHVGHERQGAPGDAGRIHLAMILDPLDPLFDPTRLNAPETQTFARALAALAALEDLWILAALRSDYLPRLRQLPALAVLLDEQRWYRLDPPAPARIRQVMEIPARVAGIEYEERAGGSGVGLVEALESDASAAVHWPPLLEQTLVDLHAHASAGDVRGDASLDAPQPRRLGMRDYRAIGGLSGALIQRAEALWDGLSQDTRDALPRLCGALIVLEGGARAYARPREGDLETLNRDPACAALLRALVAARLVVVESVIDTSAQIQCAPIDPGPRDYFSRVLAQTRDEWRARIAPMLGQIVPEAALAAPETAHQMPDEQGINWRDYRSIAYFIHPALLERWSPVSAWLADADNRRDLILRNQITRQARLYKRTDCNREYLLGEAGFAATRGFAQTYAADLEPLEQEFLDHSWARIRFQRRRNRATIASTLALILLFAGIALFSIWNAAYEARLNLERSHLRDADIAIERGDSPRAIRLAWNAGSDLPAQATDRLARAIADNRLLAMLPATDSTTEDPAVPAFSDDGKTLLTFSDATGAWRWARDGRRLRPVERLTDPNFPIHSVLIAGQGAQQRLLGLGLTGVWALPAQPGQTPTWPCGIGARDTSELDQNGQLLALPYQRDTGEDALCLIDLTERTAPRWDRVLPDDSIRDLAFNADGTQIALASLAGRVLILNTATGEEVGVLPPQGTFSRPVIRVLFSADSEQIAVAALDEQVRIFDRHGQQIAVLGSMQRGQRSVKIHQSSVRALAFSSDGRSLVAGDGTGQVVRWDLDNGTAEVLGEHDLAIDQVHISSRLDPYFGEHLALSVSQDRTVRLWRLESGRDVAVLSQAARLKDARFSLDGQRIMTTGLRDGSARLWSVRPENTLAFRLPQNDHVAQVALAEAALDSGAGLLLAAGAYDGKIAVWDSVPNADPAPPTKRFDLNVHRGPVRHLAFSPSRRWLASGSTDGTARVWDLATGVSCRIAVASKSDVCLEDGAPDCPDVYQVGFAPDERWLITASKDASQPVRLWNPLNCEAQPLPDAFDILKGRVRALAIRANADGSVMIATGNTDGALRVLRRDPMGIWSKRCVLEAHYAPIAEIAFSPDGRWLATASRDGRAALIALQAGQCGEPRYLEADAGILYGVRFAPDSKALVTAAFEAKAHLWSVDGTLLAELSGHQNRVSSVEFSPDGRWIMTASSDGAVRVWKRPLRVRTTPEEPYLTLDADLGGLTQAVFGPEGKTIAAGYWDNTAILWRLWDGEPSPELVKRWGQERARLALIDEADSFQHEMRSPTNAQ